MHRVACLSLDALLCLDPLWFEKCMVLNDWNVYAICVSTFESLKWNVKNDGKSGEDNCDVFVTVCNG